MWLRYREISTSQGDYRKLEKPFLSSTMIAKLLLFIALILPISCFLDTGSVYFNQELPSRYIIDSKLLVNEIGLKCSSLANKKLNIYRISEFDAIPKGNFIKHVQYDLLDNLDDFFSLCDLESEVTEIKSVDEISYNGDELILVQQVPRFTKRSEQVYDEYAEDLKAIESIAASESDTELTILEDEVTKPSKTSGSLFTKYQFFSAGIFMCLIVSFFLVFVLVNALSWLNSIEITYQSFEKQVDLEKKNE